ncbi:MAG: universal stress protein [Halobacteriales archaeon]|nr:universal stress protein [Halobacteriales archaeon]
MYENVLVPTDGSEGTDAAVEHALDIAKKYDATVHVIYVVNTSAYSTLPADSNWESITAALEDEGKQATSEIVERMSDEGVDAVPSIEEGIPHKTILSYADENDIDLIVMGTHGKSGLDRLLLGSVTEKVVRKAEIPVLTVRMVDDEGEEEE